MMPFSGVYHNRAGLETGFHGIKQKTPLGAFPVDPKAILV